MRFSNKIVSNIVPIIRQTLQDKSTCNVLLTGGRSAARVYKKLSEMPEFIELQDKLEFYFGDERCVLPNDPESNYHLVQQALFLGKVPTLVTIHRIHGEAKNLAEEAERYSTLLPCSFDLVLLSVGEDGHIASLFPGSLSLDETGKKMMVIFDAPKAPSKRITVSPSIIKTANNVIVMACGAKKGRVLAHALQDASNVSNFPVLLAIGRIWILDKAATASFFVDKPKDFYNTGIIHA